MELKEQYKLIFNTVKFGQVLKIDGFHVQLEYRTDNELVDDLLSIRQAGFETSMINNVLDIKLN